MVLSNGDSSDPVDPLAGCSSFSLFPLSFNPSSHPNPNFDLHSHLKAMALRSPDKLLKQATTILDDNVELLKTDKISVMASENRADKVSSMIDTNPQEKRPALGLKRAKFSAKPMPSQPDVVSQPSLDIDKLKDPVEFFAAYEKMENANKELQRLRGQPLVNLDQNLAPLSPRRRRPSLFGKSATYKHHSYSSTVVDDNGETSLSSQKTSEKHITAPICQDALPETDVVKNSQHTKVSDSTPAMTREQSELDEFLSCDYGALDVAGVLVLLQEKLQIKPKDYGKPALPDLLDVQQRKSEASCDTLLKMTDAITSLNGIRKAAGSKRLSLTSQLRERSSVRPQVSAGQSKSPLALIKLLNGRNLESSPSKDPFSAHDIDSPPVRNPSPETVRGRQLNNLDTREGSGTSLVHGEENIAAANDSFVSEENITAQSSEPKEQLDGVSRSDMDGAGKDIQEHEKSARHGEETTALSSEFTPSLEAKDISSTSEPKECTDEATQSGQVGEKMDVCDFSRYPTHREQSVADVGEDLLVLEERGIDPSSESMEQGNEVDAAGDSVRLDLNVEGCNTEKSSVHEVEECTIGEVMNTEDICMEEPNKEAAEPSKRKLENRRKSKVAANTSKETVKKGGNANAQADALLLEKTTNRKRKATEAPRASKKEHLSRRNSLYAAGTKWEAGLRRSTRIKMRPLEYWRGERFLYGRVHDSLVTVIGVKYGSPSQDAEKPKVKSFVSDEYKELVDLAALH